MKTIEYVMRCKLPEWPGPELNDEYRTAIFANKPEGFEISWETRLLWPVDKEGMTWVRLYLTDEKMALAYLNELYGLAMRRLDRMRELARKIEGS